MVPTGVTCRLIAGRLDALASVSKAQTDNTGKRYDRAPSRTAILDGARSRARIYSPRPIRLYTSYRPIRARMGRSSLHQKNHHTTTL